MGKNKELRQLEDEQQVMVESFESSIQDAKNGVISFEELKRTILSEARQHQQKLIDAYERETGEKYVPNT